ncbi:MAG TPA: response regulator [Dehalococcoidia bacterium]|nr:response regulator [Dehalococcoidia bacterium]
MSVLIVEPNAAEGMLLRALLERERIAAVVVAGLDEAVATLSAAETPYVVLAGHVPPASDGLKILDAARADVRWSTLPVVLIPEEASEVLVREAISLQCDGIVTKPVRGPGLPRAVQRAREAGFEILRDQREVARNLGLDLRGYQQSARALSTQIQTLLGLLESDSQLTPEERHTELRALDEPLNAMGANRALYQLHEALSGTESAGAGGVPDPRMQQLVSELRRLQTALLAAA